MAPHLELLLLAAFAALMIAAAVADWRRLVIPNKVVEALCLLWPLRLAASGHFTLGIVFPSLASAIIILVGGTFLFARGLIGGGDVKLIAAASLWLNPAAVPALLMMTGLLGGILALATLARLNSLLGRRNGRVQTAGIAVAQAPIPYGAAIAAAALIVMIASHLG